MIKAILFDFDGTIVDSLKHHLSAYRKAYLHFGKDLTDEEIIQNAFYTVIEEKTARYKIADREKFKELYSSHLEEAFKELELHQNLIQVLNFFKKKNIKMAIISFASSEKIKIRLIQLKINRYFDLILGRKDVTHQKPHPEIAQKAMEKLKVKADETLLIGDTSHDILTGKNAKVMTALFVPEVNRMFSDLDFLSDVKADFEFHNFSELPERLKRFL